MKEKGGKKRKKKNEVCTCKRERETERVVVMLRGKFQTFIIILLISIRGEKKCEREGRKKKKEKK